MKLARVIFAVMAACPVWAQTTVVVSGRVTDGAGLPVEEAIISLTQGEDKQTRLTDAGGGFSFEEARPGTAQIEIAATGFLAFQKTNSDEASIQIAADHATHNFKLTAAGEISGRIIFDKETGGREVRGVIASLMREDYTDGIRHFVPAGRTDAGSRGSLTTIDEDGGFRFPGLEPGRYLVSAGPPGGTFVVGIVFNGDQIKQLNPTEGYVTMYYPGTTQFSDAMPITVAAGETRTLEFKIAKQRLFRVSGTIELLHSDGSEPGVGSVSVVSVDDGGGQRAYSGKATVPGTFTIESLPAGQYEVRSFAVPGATTDRGVSMWIIRTNFRFAVTDHDLEGLKVLPQAVTGPIGAAGKFRMANSSPLPKGLAVQFSYTSPGTESTKIPAADTGEFWVNGAPGEYSLLPVLPPGYAATDIRYGGTSYLNSLIPMTGTSEDNSMEIVVSDQPGRVTGTLVDGNQKPIPARIVLVPDPLPAGFDWRAIRAVSTDKDGAFMISGLPPGRYKAVALTGDDRKRDHDLALLEDKIWAADGIEVVTGGSVSIRLVP